MWLFLEVFFLFLFSCLFIFVAIVVLVVVVLLNKHFFAWPKFTLEIPSKP